MSKRRLLLDGPDLQALVRQAEEAGGRVVRAERTRRGLLGRTWYEVSVEVPGTDPPGGHLARPASRAAEASTSVPAGAGRGPTPRGPAAPGACRAPTPPRPAGPSRGPTPPGPAGIRDLLAAAEAAERADQVAGHAARAARKRATKEDGGR